jgi:hypothetical protein
MSTEVLAALATTGPQASEPAAETARVANAFDAAVLSVRQENGTLAAGGAGGSLTEGLRAIHSDSQRMAAMLTRLADRPGEGAAPGWNYQGLQVGGPQPAEASVGRASTADLMQLYQMMTRTQLLSKVCNMVPDVCTSIIKAP